MNVSLYVGSKFGQINDQFQKHVCNLIECILGADAGAGMKLAKFLVETPVIVAKGQNGSGGRSVFAIWDVVLSIDDLAVRGENKSFIACVKGQNTSMEGERSVLELMSTVRK